MGNTVKIKEWEVFDIKGNAEGLWTEKKYRDTDNKMVTLHAFYEGCKN
jgi:hypothetical protein